MALLKRIQGSTLMETLVATVLIVIIFMVASLLLNNMFFNNLSSDTAALKEHLSVLEYQWHSGVIPSDYAEKWKDWEIQILKQEHQLANKWVLKAKHLKTQEILLRTVEYAH